MIRGVTVKSRLIGKSFSTAVPTVKNFINGKFEESTTNKWIDLHNPATGELLCRVPQSTPEELKRAEEGAAKAFKTWKEVPVQQRQVTFIPLMYFFPALVSL